MKLLCKTVVQELKLEVLIGEICPQLLFSHELQTVLGVSWVEMLSGVWVCTFPRGARSKRRSTSVTFSLQEILVLPRRSMQETQACCEFTWLLSELLSCTCYQTLRLWPGSWRVKEHLMSNPIYFFTCTPGSDFSYREMDMASKNTQVGCDV